MLGRRNIARALPFLLAVIALGCFLGAYNVATLMILSRRGGNGGNLEGDHMGRGLLGDPLMEMAGEARERVPFHVALTATDAPYIQWQCRIMYYWYREQRERSGSDMGGFTRILHSGKEDELMDEIPSFVVDPLPTGLDRVSGCFVMD